MGKIKVLDAKLANMIAAGEVIERPSSVVKELLENAIDAEANEIVISIKEAGRKEIQVRDNGYGMNKEDILASFTRHATSKISRHQDLFNIGTLGFRGEALPSIAAVSRVTLQSCTKGNHGWRVQVEENQIKKIEPSDSRVGTTVIVQDLFYRTPARLKHLRSDNAEIASIYEVVTNVAFAYPEIKITLINNDRESFNSSGNGNLQEIIAKVYGLETAKQLIAVDFNNNDFQVSGYIGKFTNHRANRRYMNFTLNSRTVRIPAIQSVLIEAYQNYLPVNRYPVAVLNIKTDPRLVDVNVHPTKREVRLSMDDSLYKLVKEKVRKVLLETSMIPKVNVEKKEKTPQPQLSLDEEDLRKILEEGKTIFQDLSKKEKTWELKESEEKLEEEQRPQLNRLQPIGQIHGTYIVAESVDGFYLIDQHAAMERINFEKYYQELSKSKTKISLLVPQVIELSYREIQIVKDKLELLEEAGIKAEVFGNNAIRVTEIPLWLSQEEASLYINGALEQVLANKNIDIMALREHAVATIACKASLKANRRLTIDEQQELLDRLILCQNPHCCPHGRPVMIFYSIYELEKLFNRVM